MANRIKRFTTIFFWCVRQDLNLHGRAHMILSHARIPIPPLARFKGFPTAFAACPLSALGQARERVFFHFGEAS